MDKAALYVQFCLWIVAVLAVVHKVRPFSTTVRIALGVLSCSLQITIGQESASQVQS